MLGRAGEDPVAISMNPPQNSLRTGAVRHSNCVRVNKTGSSGEPFHAGLARTKFQRLALRGGHICRVMHEISELGLLANLYIDAKNLSGAPPIEQQRTFAKRLTGDGAGVGARASQNFGRLD